MKMFTKTKMQQMGFKRRRNLEDFQSKPPSHICLQDSQIEIGNPPIPQPNIMSLPHQSIGPALTIFFAHFTCILLSKGYIFQKCYISWQFLIYLFIVKTQTQWQLNNN